MNIEEVAALFSVSKQMVYTWTKDGRFVKPVKFGYRTARYPKIEVETIFAAMLAGSSNNELTDLVEKLLAGRNIA